MLLGGGEGQLRGNSAVLGSEIQNQAGVGGVKKEGDLSSPEPSSSLSSVRKLQASSHLSFLTSPSPTCISKEGPS